MSSSIHNRYDKFIHAYDEEYRNMRLGLDRIRSFLTQIGHPEDKYPSVLIGGTNGKGSVSGFLESILTQAGIKVGCYRSPHLMDFTERIRIQAQNIEPSTIEKVLSEWEQAGYLLENGKLITAEAQMLTWFEQVTVLAFEIFRRHKISIALLEVGLGGRFDATNVVNPLLSMITSIGLDHQEILGDSMFEIAREKAGIMRQGKPVILGVMEEKVRNFLAKAAGITEAKAILPQLPKGSTEAFFYRHWPVLKLPKIGAQQLKNVACVLEAVELMREQGFNITEDAVALGLQQFNLPGRFEVCFGPPEVVLDVAHNVQAQKALVQNLKKYYPNKNIIFVFGMLKDKDCLGCLRLFKNLPSKWIFTEVASKRTYAAGELIHFAKIAGLNFSVEPNAKEAFAAATKIAGEKDIIVVTGSLYLVGEIRSLLKRA